MLTTFSRFSQDAAYPYGSGGPNGSFSLMTSHYMNTYGIRREDFGKLCVAQRDNALKFPHALMKKPLTLDEYMNARLIADPIVLYDCVMPCAGGEAFLVMREVDARAHDLPYAYILSSIERHTRSRMTLYRFAAAGRSTSTSSGAWPVSVRATSTCCRPMTTIR